MNNMIPDGMGWVRLIATRAGSWRLDESIGVLKKIQSRADFVLSPLKIDEHRSAIVHPVLLARRITQVKRFLVYAGIVTTLASSVNAVYAEETSGKTDESLTWFGITLYGTVDVGYTYQNRGTPRSDYFP